ncbi:hypothetical protein EYF80_016346 [Liparis tanakae]|uniref:Uncharacterized protein n=1 Tax=Liparis tanakae TaxID=230148 RepID=A0A4Z2I7X1_9TELE|nr:hypothetical protein EYF80_016346 [Liparis tanakae]
MGTPEVPLVSSDAPCAGPPVEYFTGFGSSECLVHLSRAPAGVFFTITGREQRLIWAVRCTGESEATGDPSAKKGTAQTSDNGESRYLKGPRGP